MYMTLESCSLFLVVNHAWLTALHAKNPPSVLFYFLGIINVATDFFGPSCHRRSPTGSHHGPWSCCPNASPMAQLLPWDVMFPSPLPSYSQNRFGEWNDEMNPFCTYAFLCVPSCQQFLTCHSGNYIIEQSFWKIILSPWERLPIYGNLGIKEGWYERGFLIFPYFISNNLLCGLQSRSWSY